MTVQVEKASFSGLHEDHLRLNDATDIACRLQSNSTHVFAVIPLNSCGTEIEVTKGFVTGCALLSVIGVAFIWQYED